MRALEGALTMQPDNELVDLGPGPFACVPPGTVHTFRNRSDQPVRFLNFNTPGGWERYMRSRGGAHRWKPDDRGDRQDRLPLRLPGRLTRKPRAGAADRRHRGARART